MPSRGYRKGRYDNLEPVTCFVRARLSNAEHRELTADAANRSMTLSKLLRAIVSAHIKGQRAELPHPRATNASALRELTRLGNNLNQLARQANTAIVPVDPIELRRVLTSLMALAARL